jgi:hypothetical protein
MLFVGNQVTSRLRFVTKQEFCLGGTGVHS